MKQGRCGLTLREIKPGYQPVIKLETSEIQAWADNLPFTNLQESSKNIYRLLVDVNQTQLTPEQRLNALNSIEPSVTLLTNALEKQFYNNRIALNDKQKQTSALAQAIQTELFIGYHALIESLISDAEKSGYKKILVQALTKAIHYHALVILRCYLLYSNVPGRMWLEVYRLYQIATLNSVENKGIELHNNKKLTPHEAFLHLLLFSTANPYQLRQPEMQKLWLILDELSDHATLRTHAFNKHHYIVSLNRSLPPVHIDLYQAKESDINLKLTLDALVEKLKHMLLSLEKANSRNYRQSMLLRHLFHCWKQGSQRIFARTPCDEAMNISIGRGAIHYQLMQEPRVEHNDRKTKPTSSLDAMEGSLKNVTLDDISAKQRSESKHDFNYLSSSESSTDIWEKLYQSKNEIDQRKDQELHQRTRAKILKDGYKLHQVSVLNMSPDGYCIQLNTQGLPLQTQTGEILGLMESSSGTKERWSIGVIRWVRRLTNNPVVQMGLQLLAPGALPVKIRLNSDGQESDSKSHRALILPALTGIAQPETIITNAISFKTNNKVRLLDFGLEYDARLTKEIASTASYRQFEFERLNNADSDKHRLPEFDKSKVSDPYSSDFWELI